MCSTANSKIGVLTRMRKLVLDKTKSRLLESVILPVLNYCSIVCLFIRASDECKLERMQKKGLWVVFHNNTSSYEGLLKKAALPALYNRTLQDLAILMFKVKNGMSLDYISELFQRLDTNYNLSNSDFMIPRFNMITFGKHSKKYLGPYLWRKLPIVLRTLTEIDKFKRKIRKSGLGGHLTEDKCASECTLCHS